MDDLEALYKQVIMEHYKYPHNKGLIDNDKYKKVHLNNPSCGDDITVQFIVEDGIIKDIKQDGHGCSICMSSASVMTDVIMGRSVERAKELIQEFLDLLTGKEIDDEELMDALVYQGVSKFPARIKCAGLSWKAIKKGIEED